MQELKANTEVVVRVGPFVDVGDGFTPQTDITLGGNEAELLKAASVEVDISGRTWAAVTNCRGWYDLTLTTADTDTEGTLTVVVQDDSDCLPVFRDFMVLSQAAWDSKYAAKDAGYMDVNIKAVSEDTAAADNLESMFDGSGYTDPAAPSTQAQVAVLSGGIAIRVYAESATVTEGTETNTYAVTHSQDGTEYIVTDDGNAPNGIDFYLQADTGAKDNYPVTLELYCRYQEGGAPYANSCKIQVWCWNTSAWLDKATMVHSTANQTYALPLGVCSVGQSGAEEGKVRVRFIQTTQEASSAVHVDYLAVLYSSVCLTSAAIVSALKASTGYTAGGTITYADLMKIVSAAIAGDVKDKAGGGVNIYDVEDGTTIVLTAEISEASPYVNYTVA